MDDHTSENKLDETVPRIDVSISKLDVSTSKLDVSADILTHTRKLGTEAQPKESKPKESNPQESKPLSSKCDRVLKGLQILFSLCFFGLGLVFFAISTARVDSFVNSIPPPSIQSTFSFLSTNLDRIPYVDLAVSMYPNCPDGFELVPLGTFPGTIDVCNCTTSDASNYTLTVGDCDLSNTCRMVPGYSPQEYFVWQGAYICGRQSPSFLANRLDCPVGYLNCYAGGCSPATDGCPIIDIIIDNNSASMTNYTKLNLTNSSSLFYLKGPGIPIISFNISTRNPCAGDQYPSTDLFSNFQNGDFQCLAPDVNATSIDQMSVKDVLTQNGFQGIVTRYASSNYGQWNLSNTFYLYTRKRVEVNNTLESCYSLDNSTSAEMIQISWYVQGGMIAAAIFGLSTTTAGVIIIIANVIKPGFFIADYGSNRFYLITEISDKFTWALQLGYTITIAVFSTVLSLGIGGSEYYTVSDRQYFLSFSDCFSSPYTAVIQSYQTFENAFDGLAFNFVGPIVVIDLFWLLNAGTFIVRSLIRQSGNKSKRLPSKV